MIRFSDKQGQKKDGDKSPSKNKVQSFIFYLIKCLNQISGTSLLAKAW